MSEKSKIKSSEIYLKETFGFPGFRNSQKEIVESIVYDQRDTLAILATGHGKSICFQLPAIMTQKPAIIISPLLSLMEDQKTNLDKIGIKACCYNSVIRDKAKLNQDILHNDYQIIYMTPEAVVNVKDLLLQINQTLGLSVIAIDEAHCVSMWGHSFRPSYTQLSCLKSWLPQVPILALTGTATPQVESDIITLLGLNNPLQVRNGSDRANLSYYVHSKSSPKTDLMSVLKGKESTIIYCPTRPETEDLAELLIAHGVKAQAYHAGLAHELKSEIHHEFLDEVITCIVATVSFGMGIDKPNIRKVIHYGCPKDMESYSQETGRAGRDGLPSQCHIFFSQSDFNTNRYFLKDIRDPSLKRHKESMVHAMEQYLYITECRRAFILNYYGETCPKGNMQCCDNCLSQHIALKVDIGPQAYQIIDLIHDFPGKFGKLMYINAIRGANLKNMPNYFKKSKYYGVGKSHSLEWWKTCVQYLINSDLIVEKSTMGGFGCVISLGPKGSKWLNQNNEKDQVPSYIITESEQVKSLIVVPKANKVIPTTKVVSATQVSPSAKLLPKIKAKIPVAVKVTISESGDQSLTATQATTYDLFHHQHKSLQEIAKIRQMTTSTIEGHISECLKAKKDLDFKRLPLTLVQYEEIMELINNPPLNGDISKLAPIKAICPPDITYYQIKCALAIDYAGTSNLL